MRTIIASILLMMLSIVTFSQNATINGNYCISASSCPIQICGNSTTNLTAGITPAGTIDSVKWFERIHDGNNWGSWTPIGTASTQTVPVGELATVGHVYRYSLVVYQGGTPYSTLAEMYVNAAPTATLISDYTACCAGTLVTFNASAGGTNYDFKVNGVIAQTGASSSFATTTLANGDNVTVTINNGTCSATSAPIPMTVYVIPQATSVTGNTPMTPVCPGTTTPVTITGLTGTGPWHLEFWNTVGGVPTTLYFDAGTTTTPTTIVNVPVATTGQNALILRVSDAHCGF